LVVGATDMVNDVDHWEVHSLEAAVPLGSLPEAALVPRSDRMVALLVEAVAGSERICVVGGQSRH
jgi:hypothetical protein